MADDEREALNKPGAEQPISDHGKTAQGMTAFDRAILAVGAVVFVGLAVWRAPFPLNDLAYVYAGVERLLHGSDPYSGTALVYPPSTLIALFPLAFFGFRAAWVLWLVVNCGLFIVAVRLVVMLCPPAYRRTAAVLGAVMLAGSSQLLAVGQPSTLAISLTAIGVWGVVSGRMPRVGAVALALSLAVKPQLAGLIVLAWAIRGPHRRWAWTAIAGAAALLACGVVVLQTQPASAQWRENLRANLAASAAPRGVEDPRPANAFAAVSLNLQTVTSVFAQDERIYNGAAYAVFAVLLAAWAVVSLRVKTSGAQEMLSVGAMAVLTLLPTYHRSYDSRLLLLALPAALVVLERRRVLGIVLCVLTVLSIVSFQNWVALWLKDVGLFEKVRANKALLILLLRESDLRLLVLYGLLLAGMVWVGQG